MVGVSSHTEVLLNYVAPLCWPLLPCLLLVLSLGCARTAWRVACCFACLLFPLPSLFLAAACRSYGTDGRRLT